MQDNRGLPFRSEALNTAYRQQIISDISKRSSLRSIEESLRNNIDWNKKGLTASGRDNIKNEIGKNILPKFNRWYDSFNGLGISVHDVCATHITLQSIIFLGNKYLATIHYKGQDHFGLDEKDIMNPKFHDLSFFRIWFLLQRWEKFGYKPFLTNMETTVTINGVRQ